MADSSQSLRLGKHHNGLIVYCVGHTIKSAPGIPVSYAQTGLKLQISASKINIDNKTRFLYLNTYWFRIIDVLICCAAAEADSHSTVFESSA
jgi:hypothetical protein